MAAEERTGVVRDEKTGDLAHLFIEKQILSDVIK